MKWLQKNNYIVILFTAFVIMAVFLIITDHGETTYEKIEIQHGDTLWTLAEHYRGDMATDKWIKAVQLENDLKNETIIVGQQITIPINENSNYIVQKITNEGMHSVEIASKEE